MVRITPPPPSIFPSPCFHHLPVGSAIIRIFNPSRHQTQALTFRFNGPRHRFDHHRGEITAPQNDSERGIYYAAFTLAGCLVEYFGDIGFIEIADECVCRVNITRTLKLLDLRGNGAMKAGSVAALAKTADRVLSQQWSRYFYENEDIYSRIDGIVYFNAHNDEQAIALYERAIDGLDCPAHQIVRLDDLRLRSAIAQRARSAIAQAALDNNLIFKP